MLFYFSYVNKTIQRDIENIFVWSVKGENMALKHYKKELLETIICMAFGIVMIGVGLTVDADVVKAANNVPMGWSEIEDKKYYLDADGNPVIGLHAIENEIYLFNADGSMYSGWVTLAGRTFYFDEAGVMQNGECMIDGNMYSFASAGDFLTGWYELGGKTYYRNEYGYDQKGFVNTTEGLFYIGEDGVVTNDFELDGKWYHTDDTGRILTGDVDFNGKVGHFSDEGEFLYGWNYKDGVYSYCDEMGVTYVGAQTIDEVPYYFDENGNLLVNTTVGMYAADEKGVLTRMELSAENVHARIDELLQEIGTDITSIGKYVKSNLKYKYMEKMETKEEMAVYALNNRRCSCYYYEALTHLMLEKAGYEVITIQGKGFVYAEHYWCLVYTTRNGVEGWYHVDPLKGQFIKTDSEMVAKGFKWNHNDYPATP